MKCPHRNVRRHGLTLVELLVVVTILVMLVGVTIPLMKSVRSGSQLEAAVRKIESMMSAAKARAITNGRPAGIVFMRDSVNPSIAYEVALAESPLPYAGEFPGKKQLTFFPIPVGHIRFRIMDVRPFRPEPSSDPADPSNDQSRWFVRPGDTIRFGYMHKHYVIREVNGPNSITLAEKPPYIGDALLHFQIFRSPRRTMVAPVELPHGAYVILSTSGMAMDRGGLALSAKLFPTGNVVLTFGSTGNLDRLYRGTIPLDAVGIPSVFRVTGPLRIDLGDGSPPNPFNPQIPLQSQPQPTPTNVHRLILHNREDRGSNAIAVDEWRDDWVDLHK